LKKLTVPYLMKKFFITYTPKRFITVFTRVRPAVPVISPNKTVHTLSLVMFKNHDWSVSHAVPRQCKFRVTVSICITT
jgi:hypothetical protein